MAGTFLLDQLVRLAAARGAVVRLLGDDRQLPAVEGGGALRLVASQPGTPQLTELYRFRDPAEAAATLQLRAGDAAAVGWYHAAGRVRSGSREAMAQAAYAGWKNDMLAGKVTLMAAADGTDVTELSAQARADRVLAGQVEDPRRAAARREPRRARGLDRHPAQRAAASAVRRPRLGQERRRLGSHAAAPGRVTGGPAPAATAGTSRSPPATCAATSSCCTRRTAHRAQGTTVDTAHPLITAGMSREALYVLATRAREKTVFYVATHDLPFDDDARVNQVRRDPRQYAGREILLNVLATEGAPLSATETITTAQEEAASLATLVPRYLHAARQDADGRYRLAADARARRGRRALACRRPGMGRGRPPAVRRRGRRLGARAAARHRRGQARTRAAPTAWPRSLAWRIDAFLADNPEPPQPAATSA